MPVFAVVFRGAVVVVGVVVAVGVVVPVGVVVGVVVSAGSVVSASLQETNTKDSASRQLKISNTVFLFIFYSLIYNRFLLDYQN